MKLISYLRSLVIIVSTIFITNLNIALAQTDDTEETTGSNKWVLAYILVVLAIALGLGAVCRPGKRKEEVKDAF